MRWLLGLVVLAPLTSAPAADYVPPPKPCPSDLTVGCFYFPGHFSPMRWMPFREAGYPMPILGYYRDGEPEVSDWHIKWAVEHGIDFFVFDWYYHFKQGPNPVHNKALDEGFLRARYRDHMDFCLMWCNETKDERYSEQDMVRLAETLTQRYFSQANYLRIDGNNVLIVSRPGYLLDSFGPEGTARIFRHMAQVSLDAACGGIFPVANGDRDAERLKQAGFRATTAYNYPYAGMTGEQKKAQRAPYDAMVRGYETAWKEVTGRGVLPYIVPVAPGWDSRPWYGDRALVRTNPRPRLFYEMCVKAKQHVDPKLRMVLAECWNEFGEGAYIEPTAHFGFGWLDAMRDAFCSVNPHHDDVVPAALGLSVPVFDQIPEPMAKLIARGGNLLFNGDVEDQWGWVLFDGMPAPRVTPGKQGQWCLRIPAGQGVKTEWRMPVPKDGSVQIHLQYRVPVGSKLVVQLALFRETAWLGRYAPAATIDGKADHWGKLRGRVRIGDDEATHFDIEFTATGGDAYVDDVDIRAPARPEKPPAP